MSSFIKRSYSLKLSFFLFLINFNIVLASQKHIAIIVPLEHEAMNQIVAGIKEELADDDLQITVKNAQGDQNIMLSIIKQLVQAGTDIIMPIGTTACQTTTSHNKNSQIVCVASFPLEIASPLATGVTEETPITSTIALLPKLKNIAVIYSASEKVIPEINLVKEYSKKHNLKLYLGMATNLMELPTIVQSVPSDTQAILILKDHLVVSGIEVLKQEANKRRIPIISADEGTVVQGATMALGIKEKEIGRHSALVVKKILKGTKAGDIPFATLEDRDLFVNKIAFDKQNILDESDLANIKLPRINISK